MRLRYVVVVQWKVGAVRCSTVAEVKSPPAVALMGVYFIGHSQDIMAGGRGKGVLKSRELWQFFLWKAGHAAPRYCPKVLARAIIERRTHPPSSTEALSSQGEAEIERKRQPKPTYAGA